MNLKAWVAEKTLPYLLSKGGCAVRWAVGYVIAGVTTMQLIPNADVPVIQQGLTTGGMAVLALLYARLQLWFYQRKEEHHAANVTSALLTPVPSKDPTIWVDDMIGDETIEEFTARTGIPVRRAERA